MQFKDSPKSLSKGLRRTALGVMISNELNLSASTNYDPSGHQRHYKLQCRHRRILDRHTWQKVKDL